MKYNSMSTPPKLGGEYLVIWDLQDGGEPCVASMDYDAQQNKWSDPRSLVYGESVTDEKEFLAWSEMPAVPEEYKAIKSKKLK